MKFCRSESAIIGSSSTTRILTSLFSTFFSSLEIAAPWGTIMVSLPYPKESVSTGLRSGKRQHHDKFLVRQFSRAAVRLDNFFCQRQPDLIAARKGTKRIVIQGPKARPFDHGSVVGGFERHFDRFC